MRRAPPRRTWASKAGSRPDPAAWGAPFGVARAVRVLLERQRDQLVLNIAPLPLLRLLWSRRCAVARSTLSCCDFHEDLPRRVRKEPGTCTPE
eukprot:scaffold59013_cov41-Phaeocystis_antarctica.AAC.1